MNKDKLIEICKNHKLEIQTDTTPYGRLIIPYLDDKKLNDNEDYENSKALIAWVYELDDKIRNNDYLGDYENLDDYTCLVNYKNGDLIFEFEFNNSWRYHGLYGDEKITPQHLLPYLPDFINQFEEFRLIELEEENVFCSFSYEKVSVKDVKLNIHDLWSEGSIQLSFKNNFQLIEKIKDEIISLVDKTFHEFDTLIIDSDDGINIDIGSYYDQSYSYEDIFVQ